MAIGNGKDKELCEGFALTERLNFWPRIVQNVGVIALGIDAKHPVGAHTCRLRYELRRVACIHIIWRWQYAHKRRAVFIDHGRGGRDNGLVIGAINGDDKAARGCAAVAIIHCIVECFRKKVCDAQLLDNGQAVVQRIDERTVGAEVEAAVEACRVCLFDILGRIGGVHILRAWQNSRGIVLVFGHGGGGRGYGWRVVKPVDGDGDRIGQSAALAVVHRVGEGFCKALTKAQPLHARQGVVQLVGIRAAGIHAEAAVIAQNSGLGNKSKVLSSASILWCGNLAAYVGIVFGQAGTGGHKGGVYLDGCGIVQVCSRAISRSCAASRSISISISISISRACVISRP